MAHPESGLVARLRMRAGPILAGPPALAFLPAVTLGAFWAGGEAALIAASLGLPVAFAIGGVFDTAATPRSQLRDAATGLLTADEFLTTVNAMHEQCRASGLKSACFTLELDDYEDLIERHGRTAADTVMRHCGERLQSALRANDTVARVGDARFAICLNVVRQLDLELCIQLAGRLQSAVEEPTPVDGISVYVSCSVGFCPFSRAPGATGEDWFGASIDALNDALSVGPSTIRAFSAEIQRKTKARSDLRDDVTAALENGQIQPWYQPQISTDTGKITGFEALARWNHPVHGLIPPDVFLPVMEDAGLLERLGQVMLYHALTALKAWDSAGVDVPRVGVNFAGDELRNPQLVDKIRWELDRFELTPDRLGVEILESVVTDEPDDVVARNITGLSRIGCRIDLDDFGTGHASIGSIRRFSVARIKIDRSFVMKADRDPEQQRLVGAILTMAERLDVETLAEGVETVGEHALLAQLGCGHVQGFGIGRPMPFDQTLDWIDAHQAKLQDTPRIGRNAG